MLRLLKIIYKVDSSFLFALAWLIISLAIAFLIGGNLFKKAKAYQTGFILIALSFICGLILLFAIISSL